MTTSITWNVAKMECHPSAFGQQNSVSMVHWTVTASDGVHVASDAGVTRIADYVGGEFTQYDELTEQQVMGWVFLALGAKKDAIESDLLASIAAQTAPVMVTLQNPW